MNDDITLEEEVARLVASDTDGLARRVSEMRGRPYGVANLTPDQEMWAWTFADATINADELRMKGMPESEVNVHKYPLRSKLMDQAGRTFADQKRYHDRMEERRLRAEAKGHLPKPPERTGGIMNEKFVPIKEV
jgi:hypothetical protein